jgi:two-component system KDP operon response regulator KdpE
VTQRTPEVGQQWSDHPDGRHAPRVLQIDSSPWDGELMAAVLVDRGYIVQLAAEGLVGLGLLEREPPDAVILDPVLPDVDGFDLCQRIRELSRVPILMLSARYDEATIVRGLGAGADDVLPRTIGLGELLARLEAVLRRSSSARQAPGGAVALGDLTIDTARRMVVRHGREVHLSAREYRLLFHLALNPGMVVTHEELLSWMWGPAGTGRDYRLRVTINRLRSKLEEDPALPRYVLTRRGIGYLLATLQSANC